MQMGKVQARLMKKREREVLERDLWEVMRFMGRQKDFDAFLKDLLTKSEILMVARRIGIAQLLLAGFTQRQINHIMEVGFSTIERVEQWLSKRWMDYRTTLLPLYEEAKRREARQARKNAPIDPMSFRALRKKYPLHFLLFNLMLSDLPEGRTNIRRTSTRSPFASLRSLRVKLGGKPPRT
jgi:uncharacterized protein YerC